MSSRGEKRLFLLWARPASFSFPFSFQNPTAPCGVQFPAPVIKSPGAGPESATSWGCHEGNSLTLSQPKIHTLTPPFVRITDINRHCLEAISKGLFFVFLGDSFMEPEFTYLQLTHTLLLLNSQVGATVTSISYRTSLPPPKKPIPLSPHSVILAPSSCWQPLICFRSL